MSDRLKQKVIGILYISLVFIGPITLIYFPSFFMEQENLLEVINEKSTTIIFWMIADSALILIEITLSTLLFLLMKKIDRKLSVYAYVSRLLMIAVMIINVVILGMMLNAETSIKAFDLLNAHNDGIYYWQVFFFMHVLIIGYTFLKHNNIVKWLSYALIAGSFGYLFDSFINIYDIDNAFLSTIPMILLLVVVVGEIGLAIALLIGKFNINKKSAL